MTNPLRQRHYQMFIAIGILLPIICAFGIVAQKPYPSMDSLPGELSAATKKFEATDWQRTNLVAKSPIQVRLVRENSESESLNPFQLPAKSSGKANS